MSIKFEDVNKVTHSVTLDIPDVDQGKFLYVNGSKKVLFKQLIMKPIVKTKSNEVQVITNYNKLFIERFGTKISQKLEFLKFLLLNDELKTNVISPNKVKVKKGNSININSKYKNVMEYDDISKYLVEITINNLFIMFNRKLLSDYFDPNSGRYNKTLSEIKYDKEIFYPIGFIKNTHELLLLKYEDEHVYKVSDKNVESLEVTISELLINNLNEVVNDEFLEEINGKKSNVKGSSKFTYNRVKINNKKVPLIVLLASEKGLREILELYKVDYEITEKNMRISVYDNKEKIKFKDSYLVYDISKIRNSLLLSGLNTMNTSDINIEEMETKIPYLNYYRDNFGSSNIFKGIHNTMTLLIDPITKEVLEDLRLPTNVYDVLLYCNTLLESLSYNKMNDMNIYRIRSTEQIPAVLYKLLGNSYKVYKDTNGRNPIKMSLPKDALIKALLELRTLDEYPELNPSLEIEKSCGVNYKGPSGTNLTEAFTKEVRSYDKSMVGTIAVNTPDSNTCGVMRQLTYNTSMANNRGYIDINRNINGNTDIFSTAELLNSYTMTHADPPRITMIKCMSSLIVI